MYTKLAATQKSNKVGTSGRASGLKQRTSSGMPLSSRSTPPILPLSQYRENERYVNASDDHHEQEAETIAASAMGTKLAAVPRPFVTGNCPCAQCGLRRVAHPR